MERDMFSVTLQMRKLRERAGLSMDEMARALGYARASSIQRYENENEFSKDYFSVNLTQKIAKALIGRGNPPIMADEVWALSLPDARSKLFNNEAVNQDVLMGTHDSPIDNWRPIHSTIHQGNKRSVLAHGSFAEADSNERTNIPNAKLAGGVNFDQGRRLPVFGQAVAGINGEFELNGNVIFDVLCPPQLYEVNNAYAVEVSGDSMWPRYRDGEIVYCDPTRRVKKGDFVVAQIMIDEYANAPQAFIKMFVRHNAKELVLEQFNPAKTLTFPHEKVVSVHYIALSGDAL